MQFLEVSDVEDVIVARMDALAAGKTWTDWMQGETGKLQRGSVLNFVGQNGSGSQHLEYDVIVVATSAATDDRQAMDGQTETEVVLYVAYRVQPLRSDQVANRRRAWQLEGLIRRAVCAARHAGLTALLWQSSELLVNETLSMLTVSIRFRAIHSVQITG